MRTEHVFWLQRSWVYTLKPPFISYMHGYMVTTIIKIISIHINSQIIFRCLHNPFLLYLLLVARQWIIFFLSLYACLHFLEFQINGILNYLLFFAWVCSLNVNILRDNHVVTCIIPFYCSLLCLHVIVLHEVCFYSPVVTIELFSILELCIK